MKNQVSSILLLITVMIIWGSSFAVTKESVNNVPPIFFALVRMSIASVILLIAAQTRGGISKIPRPIPWMIILLMGLTGTCLYYICFNTAMVYTMASMGALIQSFIPVVTVILAFIFLKEPVSVRKLVGIGISIAGVLFIIFMAAPSGKAKNPLLGNLLMLASVFIWATYTILAKRVAHIDPIMVTAYSIALGTLFLIPAAFVELSGKSIPKLSGQSWLSAIYLGAISTSIGLLLYNRSLKYLEASQTASFLNLMPVIGVSTAVIFLGEHLTLWQVFGGVLVLTGVFISIKK
jgi:drug/metabolite transporter (DMT)-like permease